MSALLEEDTTGFLRGAGRIELGPIAGADVEQSFTRAFVAAGFGPAPGDTHRAADASAGYPFLIQTVGYYIWREAESRGGTLTAGLVDRVIARALRWHEKTVVRSALAAVTDQDLEFLYALAADGPATGEDLGHRMGAAAVKVPVCRDRLLAAGLIEAAEQDRVGFALPVLRQYLRSTRTE